MDTQVVPQFVKMTTSSYIRLGECEDPWFCPSCHSQHNCSLLYTVPFDPVNTGQQGAAQSGQSAQNMDLSSIPNDSHTSAQSNQTAHIRLSSPNPTAQISNISPISSSHLGGGGEDEDDFSIPSDISPPSLESSSDSDTNSETSILSSELTGRS